MCYECPRDVFEGEDPIRSWGETRPESWITMIYGLTERKEEQKEREGVCVCVRGANFQGICYIIGTYRPLFFLGFGAKFNTKV